MKQFKLISILDFMLKVSNFYIKIISSDIKKVIKTFFSSYKLKLLIQSFFTSI